MIICKKRLALLLTVAAVATPVSVRAQQSRTIEVPASKKWQHAETGIVVPQALAGLPRGAIADSGAGELDVSVQFGSPETTQLTLYVFRPALADVPVWFDRVETQILGRDVYGKATPGGDPVAFAPPRATEASALRRVYAPGKRPYTATGAAMLPLGEWLVAIRLSSTTLDPAALDAKLLETIDGLGWPMPAAGATPSSAAVPVQPCATALSFSNKAKLKKPDMTMALLGAALVGVAQDPKTEKIPIEGPRGLCREGASEMAHGTYRWLSGGTGYVIALGDAGRTISVDPEFPLEGGRPGYAVTLNDLSETYVFPAFDRLPAPAKVVEMVRKTNPVSSMSRGGKNMTINMR